jgi:uncharacterized membrane protein YjgN (DUF898 family)
MIKSFLILTLLLLTMLITISLHYFQSSTKNIVQRLQTLTQLTHDSRLSLSVAYDESYYNPSYPEMPNLKKMDFIYE